MNENTPATTQPDAGAVAAPVKWSCEQLEAEYREICNNLIDLIDEKDLGKGRGGEKIDKIVCFAFRQQSNELTALRKLAGEAAEMIYFGESSYKMRMAMVDRLRKAQGGEGHD